MFANIKTAEEFIRYEINANKGTQNVILKNELVNMANSYDIETNEKMTKDDIFLLLKEKMPIEEIAAKCNLGVSSYDFQKKYDITHDEVKRMARHGFIKTTGSERFRAYGKDRYADLYSVFDYFQLSYDEVHKWLADNPKGTRKCKIKK